ncbi:MAG: hypothetical protein K2K34_02545 [Oscillospiraceae bacterium]|nr:hypothetical protein [Oscillospiraceae bacterium]
MNWLQKRKDEKLLKQGLSESVNVLKLQPDSFNVQKYQKLEFSNLSIASDIASIAPTVMLSIANTVAANSISKVLQGGVYQLVLKDGCNNVLKWCKNSEGYLITSYLDTDKKFNQAGLKDVGQEIVNPLKVAQAAQVVAIAMQVVSVVVGEYYRCEINTKLVRMYYELHNITSYMNNLQLSEILSAFDYLTKVSRDFSGMLLNHDQIVAALTNVHRIKQLAVQNLNLFKMQLNDLVDQFDATDKDTEAFVSKVNNFNLYLSLYKASIKLYAFSTAVEIMLSGNYSKTYLDNCAADVNSFVKTYSEEWDKINTNAYLFFNSTYALKPNIIERIIKFFTGKLGEYQEEVKQTQEDICNHYKDNFDSKVIESEAKPFIKYIKDLNTIYNEELTVYYCNGDLYIEKDFLETEEN